MTVEFRGNSTIKLEPAIRSGFENSTANRLKQDDYPIHNWYRFVLSYPPHLVRYFLNQFRLSKDATVLDPFCGTGTTLVECKKQGIESVGFEALPLSHFVSKTKTNWSGDGHSLMNQADSISKNASYLIENTSSKDILRLFQIENGLLLKNSISKRPLEMCIALLNSIDLHFKDKGSVYQDYAKLAFASALVHDASNLHFGPEVGVRKIKDEAPVFDKWKERVCTFARDLTQISENRDIVANVYNVDARRVEEANLPLNSIDAVITSPPYPNEKDYTRITRLESVFLGYIRTKEELRDQKKKLVRSNTRGVYRDDEDHLALEIENGAIELANEIEARRVKLNKTSGFEKNYSAVVRQYFGGMSRHFKSLSPYLKRGAQLAYVVGDQASYFQIMIRTGELLVEVAKQNGYEHVGTELFRTRIATATRRHLREEVVILRWPG